MRRVNVKNGLKQRLNEILGTDSGTEGEVSGITSWSIQAAMIENFRRLGKAIVGDDAATHGRAVSGLLLSATPGDTNFTITPGIGITPAGNMFVLNSALTVNITLRNTTVLVYAQHVLAELSSTDPNGNLTPFTGVDQTEEQIVYDDKASTTADTSILGALIYQDSNAPHDLSDYVYLGSIVMGASTITSCTPTTYRSSFNTVNGDMQVNGNLTVALNATANNITAISNLNAPNATIGTNVTAGNQVSAPILISTSVNRTVFGSVTYTGYSDATIVVSGTSYRFVNGLLVSVTP